MAIAPIWIVPDAPAFPRREVLGPGPSGERGPSASIRKKLDLSGIQIKNNT
jgi:hypothetical protein